MGEKAREKKRGKIVPKSIKKARETARYSLTFDKRGLYGERSAAATCRGRIWVID